MEEMAINGTVPSLPQDIIFNILKRLPVRDLLRFRCVCKHWRNLFKTPSFIQEHLHHSTHHNSSLLIAPKFNKDDFYLLSLNQELQFRQLDVASFIQRLEIDGLRFVGSSNGLLCFQDPDEYPQQVAPVLWNPATREVRRVPVNSDDFSEGFSNKYWIFGFGFSPIIKDYRIVRRSLFRNVCKVEVYSLNTGCWRSIGFDKIKDISLFNCVTANGVMFWHGQRHIVDRHYIDVVVSFDLAMEVFTVIPWPAFAEHDGKLAVYDDKVAIISYPKTEKDAYGFSSLYFGVLEEGDIDIGSSRERWSLSKKYISNSKLPLDDATIWRNQIVAVARGVAAYPQYRDEDEGIIHLYLTDVNANDCKQFDITRPEEGRCVCVFNYVESLVPISGNIQIEEP